MSGIWIKERPFTIFGPPLPADLVERLNAATRDIHHIYTRLKAHTNDATRREMARLSRAKLETLNTRGSRLMLEYRQQRRELYRAVEELGQWGVQVTPAPGSLARGRDGGNPMDAV